MLALWQALAAPHLAERLDGGADDVGGGVVHAGEDRVVVAAQPVRRLDRRGSAPARFTASISAGVVHGARSGRRRPSGRRPSQALPVEHAELARPAAS